MGLAESLQPPRGGKPKGTFPPKMLGADTRRAGGVGGGDRAGTGSQGSPGKAATPRIGHWGRDGREGGDLGRPTDKDALHRKGEGTGDQGESRSSGNGAGVWVRTAKKFVALARKAGTLFILKWATLPEPVGASTCEGQINRASRTSRGRATAEAKHGVYTLYLCVIDALL